MRIAIALLIAVAVSACGTVQQTPTTVYSQPVVKSEHKFERTYELGVPMQAYVGEQMVRVQDYHVTEAQSGTTSTQLSATENFTLKIPPFMKVQVTPGEPIVVTGTTERDGRRYRVVQLSAPTTYGLRFLIDDSGAFEGSALNLGGSKMGWSYKPTPDTVRLVPAKSETRVDTAKGFVNYELVYSGTTKDSFQLLYREYTQADMARPAFSQTLVYDKDSGTIRFRKMQIDVQEASNELIRFTVIDDGLGAE